jgi:hypothetical protein
VEVLAVAIPFEPLIHWLANPSFGQRLADAESACGRVPSSLLLVESTDPTRTAIVGAVATEDMVHLVNEVSCKLQVFRLIRGIGKAEQVANRECIGPKVTDRLTFAGNAGTREEIFHDPLRKLDA